MDALKKENESLKTSVQSINILKQLLKDRDELLNVVGTKVRTYEICIDHLQSRLHRNKLETSVKLFNGEVFVPGHDKEFLNDLLNETIRLHKILNAGYSSDEVAEATQTIATMGTVIDALSESLSRKENEFDNLLQVMNSSGDVQRQHISQQTELLKGYYEQRDYDDELRRTMNSEVVQTKLKLEVICSEMGNMAKELKNHERKAKQSNIKFEVICSEMGNMAKELKDHKRKAAQSKIKLEVIGLEMGNMANKLKDYERKPAVIETEKKCTLV